MRKLFKPLMALVVTFAMVFTNVSPAFAEGATEVISDTIVVSEDGVGMQLSVNGNTYYDGITVGPNWTTIATSTSGFNCNVYIKSLSLNTSGITVLPTAIRMLDRSGNVVWSEDNAIAGLGERTFWCGSDVYTIQAKMVYTNGVIYIHQV